MNPRDAGGRVVLSVRDDGPEVLAMRAAGAELRQKLEKALKPTEDRLIILDFASVKAITNSFADELVGKLYISLAGGTLTSGGVHLTGLDEETREAIVVCLERRKLIAVDADEQSLLAAEDFLQTTHDQAKRLGTFIAADLASDLAITLPNANNRLKRLVDAGALVRVPDPGRERGGKQYSYSIPDQNVSTTN
ncbi:STAS-like domain-containing protein [Actinomadura sp. 3N508]|uniref:STAS-like domain-containing protein n=1 Tax=Actinomadura sp. 3N508 TaxID=3375153 RepID=UPI0037A7F9CB